MSLSAIDDDVVVVVVGYGHDIRSTQPSRLADVFVRRANVPKNRPQSKK